MMEGCGYVLVLHISTTTFCIGLCFFYIVFLLGAVLQGEVTPKYAPLKLDK